MLTEIDSGRGTRLAVSVEELFALFVSPAAETLAVVLTLPDAELLTLTTRGIVAANAPGTIGLDVVHVRTCAAGGAGTLQFQPFPAADLKVNCGSRVSVTVIVPDVEAAPTLRMAISKTLLTPAPKLPLCDVRIERSGPSVTESVEELLVVFESPVIATVAVLVIRS